MALVVIATKLLFPFDDARRQPKSPSDMTALKMDWEVWQQVQGRGNVAADDNGASSHLTYANAFTMTESQSVELADDRLDQYLDWCEGNIASEEVRERGRAGRDAEFRRTLFRMFPTHNVEPRAEAEIGMAGTTSADTVAQV